MNFPSDATLADVGEFAVIDALIPLLGDDESVYVGPGDDAAVLRVRNGHVVVSTDVLVEQRHFRRDWVPARDVGHRAAAANLSDINAMGGTATWLTVGIAAPRELEVSWVMDFVRGFVEEADVVGARVVGGDLTQASEVVISVTAMGGCAQTPVLRHGAKPGDVVALCGRQGWAAGGLAVLGRGFRSPRALVEAYRRPEPPYAEGAVAAQAGATSMIDISDGLLAEAGHLARSSGVCLDLDPEAFEVAEPLHAVGAALGADPLSFVLTGGDDHALLATFSKGSALPEGWRKVGTVSACPAGAEPAVTVAGAAYDQGPTGWTHF